MSPIEQSIKQKIETIGTPLKNWDIHINYGIKTGCNEAFIISGAKKDELIAEDPKSADIIRPILRGKDIKRYGYDFADLWLINVHNGLKEKNIAPIIINHFPAIKRHLDNYYFDLEKRADNGMHYKDGVQNIGTIFLSKKSCITISANVYLFVWYLKMFYV